MVMSLRRKILTLPTSRRWLQTSCLNGTENKGHIDKIKIFRKKITEEAIFMDFFIKLPAFLAVLLLVGCGGTATRKATEPIIIDTLALRDGDLLFRMGLEGGSRVVATVGGGNFSHVGLAWRKNGEWMVIHAVPNEVPPGEEDRIKCEPLDSFFAPQRACRGAWRQVDCADSIAAEVARAAYEKYLRKIAFDHDYDLWDTTRFYCTELVWYLYRKQGIDLAEERRHELVIPGKTSSYLFPQDLWTSSWLKPEVRDSINP